jgi:hypothetical protein
LEHISCDRYAASIADRGLGGVVSLTHDARMVMLWTSGRGQSYTKAKKVDRCHIPRDLVCHIDPAGLAYELDRTEATGLGLRAYAPAARPEVLLDVRECENGLLPLCVARMVHTGYGLGREMWRRHAGMFVDAIPLWEDTFFGSKKEGQHKPFWLCPLRSCLRNARWAGHSALAPRRRYAPRKCDT